VDIFGRKPNQYGAGFRYLTPVSIVVLPLRFIFIKDIHRAKRDEFQVNAKHALQKRRFGRSGICFGLCGLGLDVSGDAYWG
jgi:hypothetical protein